MNRNGTCTSIETHIIVELGIMKNKINIFPLVYGITLTNNGTIQHDLITTA